MRGNPGTWIPVVRARGRSLPFAECGSCEITLHTLRVGVVWTVSLAIRTNSRSLGGKPVWSCALSRVASPSRCLIKSEWRREAGFAGEQRRKVEFFAAYARVAPSEFPPFLMGERAGECRFNGRRTSWVLANSEQGLRRGEGAEGRGENRMSGGRCDPLLSRRRR